jgi:hypothetical protein
MADPGLPRHFSGTTLAKVIPGQTTKAQITTLLGQPWHTAFPSEPNESGPEIWEYRGVDSNGTYRVHIEFNKCNVATLFAKIPDKTGRALPRVAEVFCGLDKSKRAADTLKLDGVLPTPLHKEPNRARQ